MMDLCYGMRVVWAVFICIGMITLLHTCIRYIVVVTSHVINYVARLVRRLCNKPKVDLEQANAAYKVIHTKQECTKSNRNTSAKGKRC